MKVLNVNSILDPINGGGIAERTYQMSTFLEKNGIDCTILTTNVGLFPEHTIQLKNINVIALPCIIKRFHVPKLSIKELKEILNIIRTIDIIHIMGHWTLINVIVYIFAKILKKPYVVCPAGSLPIYGRSRFIKKAYNLIIGKKIIKNANSHIAITFQETEQYERYGVNPQKVIIVPNGINESNFTKIDDAAFRNKYGLKDKKFLLFIGRLNVIKGPDLLLKAFGDLESKLLNYDLVFAGPDQGMKNDLIEIANQYKIEDRIHFINYLGGEDKSMAFHAAEFLIIPSRQEAMSIVVLEAGICGTPVLITDQCGFDEVEYIGGGKVVAASVDGLRKGLLELYESNEKLNDMGKNLQKFIKQNYSWDIIVQRIIKLYDSILNLEEVNASSIAKLPNKGIKESAEK